MARCAGCRKSQFRCSCTVRPAGVKEKETVKVKDKTGRARTVTRNTGNTVRDGNVWCGSCSCRRINGKCTNATCSTNRGA